MQRFDGCVHLCLLELSLLVILAVPQQLAPGKGTVPPVIAAAGKPAPHLQQLRGLICYVLADAHLQKHQLLKTYWRGRGQGTAGQRRVASTGPRQRRKMHPFRVQFMGE